MCGWVWVGVPARVGGCSRTCGWVFPHVWVGAHARVCVVYASVFYSAVVPLPRSTQMPLLIKKEEIFDLLCEHSVPMSRSTWFIKVRGGWSTLALWEGLGG